MTQYGILYGIGVGPGDPELITLKAVRAMNSVATVFAAANERKPGSLALDIARPNLKADANVVTLPFPHTFKSVDGNEPHREAAKLVVEALEGGKDAAFLTLGDPMTYSTFSYVMTAVKELAPEVTVRVVPGVTSFAAAAAATLQPLAEGDETLTVVGASRVTGPLTEALAHSENVVIMKPYRNAEKVCELLDGLGLGDSTWFCAECSRDTELIAETTAKARPELGRYMSLFIVKRRKR